MGYEVHITSGINKYVCAITVFTVGSFPFIHLLTHQVHLLAAYWMDWRSLSHIQLLC